MNKFPFESFLEPVFERRAAIDTLRWWLDNKDQRASDPRYEVMARAAVNCIAKSLGPWLPCDRKLVDRAKRRVELGPV